MTNNISVIDNIKPISGELSELIEVCNTIIMLHNHGVSASSKAMIDAIIKLKGILGNYDQSSFNDSINSILGQTADDSIYDKIELINTVKESIKNALNISDSEWFINYPQYIENAVSSLEEKNNTITSLRTNIYRLTDDLALKDLLIEQKDAQLNSLQEKYETLYALIQDLNVSDTCGCSVASPDEVQQELDRIMFELQANAAEIRRS